MRKLIMSFAVFFGLLFVCTGVGHADNPIRLYLDSRQLQPEVPPRIVNGSTMVPVRIISEELGAEVTWSQSDQRVTVEKSGLKLQMQVNHTEVTVNGAPDKLEAAPILVNGNTLLPVRFISENLGLMVVWDDLTRSVSLYNKSGAVPVSGNGPEATPVPAGATPKPAEATPKPAGATPKPAETTPKPKPSESEPPKETHDTPGTGKENAVVQQIILNGDTLKIVSSEGSIQPKFITLGNPERLVIDLPGTVLGKTVNGSPAVQNGEITIDHPYISKIRYAQFQEDPSVVRVVIDLKRKIEYNLLESKNPRELAISLKTFQYRIVLDAGHGDQDPGAISAAGRKEKDFNLALVLKIAKHLESVPQLAVKLTRSDDSFLKLDERTTLANNLGAHLFVSIHANNFTKESVKGVETYYTREDSRTLSDVLHRNILAAAGSNDRGVRTADYYVTKNTVMPAVLCEIGYLSNPEEELNLFDEEVQERIAASIAAGIKEYLQIP